MRVTSRSSWPATDAQVISEVQAVLERRGAMKHPPVTLAVSDSVALGIASLFSSATPSGLVLERFARQRSIDSAELIEALTTEQGYASAEGHAALHCLNGWIRSRIYRVEDS